MTAREKFNLKYPVLVKDLAFRVRTSWRYIPEHVRKDIIQEAALHLWHQCQRLPANRIKANYSTREGFIRVLRPFLRDVKRLDGRRVVRMVNLAAAGPPAVRMGNGVRYTITDAKLDDPGAFDEGLIDGSEAARRLGLSRTRVTQLAGRLGGKRVGRLLLFPADVAERYRADLAAKQAETITTRQLAERLGISEQAIAARAHRLGGRKVGRHWRFPADTGLEPGFKLPKLPARIRKRSDA